MDTANLSHINSNYILTTISTYIPNKSLLKIFRYSKKFQEKLGLSLFNYQEAYINSFNIDWKKLLSLKYTFNNLDGYSLMNKEKVIKEYDKNYLVNRANTTLSNNKINLNLEIVGKIVSNYYSNLKLKNQKGELIFDGNEYKKTPKDIMIDIYSPFFETISKEDIFNKIFSIVIISAQIEKLDLKNDYISVFNRLNAANSKYSAISFFFQKCEEINNYKEFINYEQIQRLTIIQESSFASNHENLLNTLFTLNSIDKNLIYLYLDFKRNDNGQGVTINKYAFDALNNFKSLSFLELKGIEFEETFQINLSNLKEIKFVNVFGITFTQKFPNLKKLNLKNCIVDKPKALMICPELEICKLDLEKNRNNEIYDIIDLFFLKKLTTFLGKTEDFLKLDKENPLKKLVLNRKQEYQVEKDAFKKILSLNTLEKVLIMINNLDEKEILTIPGCNNTIKELTIWWMNLSTEDIDNCKLFEFQNKFPNLTKINLKVPMLYAEEPPSLTIIENENSKINDIIICDIGYINVQLFIGPYKNLNNVTFKINQEFSNFKTFFPLFNDICPVVFHNLTFFQLISPNERVVDLNIMNNIYNNIDCMPNLKHFYFLCCSKDATEDLYKKLIIKILMLKLNFVYLAMMSINRIPNETYSLNELNEFCPKINCDSDNLNVYKFQKKREFNVNGRFPNFK